MSHPDSNIKLAKVPAVHKESQEADVNSVPSLAMDLWHDPVTEVLCHFSVPVKWSRSVPWVWAAGGVYIPRSEWKMLQCDHNSSCSYIPPRSASLAVPWEPSLLSHLVSPTQRRENVCY